jgi:hypothetical protein
MDPLATKNNPLPIGQTLSTTWDLIKGIKGRTWLVLAGLILISLLLNTLVGVVLGVKPENQPFWATYLLLPLITNALIAPFYAGALMIAIKHIRGEATTFTEGYHYFRLYLPLAITMVLVAFISSLLVIIVNIPMLQQALGKIQPVVEVVAGVISLVVYCLLLLSMPLVSDRKLPPLKAIALSFQKVKPHLPQVFILLIISYLLLIASILPMVLGIALAHSAVVILGFVLFIVAVVWVMPFIFLLQGMIYNKLVDQKIALEK